MGFDRVQHTILIYGLSSTLFLSLLGFFWLFIASIMPSSTRLVRISLTSPCPVQSTGHCSASNFAGLTESLCEVRDSLARFNDLSQSEAIVYIAKTPTANWLRSQNASTVTTNKSWALIQLSEPLEPFRDNDFPKTWHFSLHVASGRSVIGVFSGPASQACVLNRLDVFLGGCRSAKAEDTLSSVC